MLTDNYVPIYRIVEDILKNSGLKPSAFVKSIGYMNINNGLKQLRDVLNGGDAAFLIGKVQEVYGRRDEFERSRAQLAAMQKDMEEARSLAWERGAPERERLARESFVPHITTITTRQIPDSITAIAFMGADTFAKMDVRSVPLPKPVVELPWPEQFARVQAIIREHYTENKGEARFFGKIKGYVYNHHFRESVVLGTDGRVLEETSTNTPAVPQGEASFSIGNKTVIHDGDCINIQPRQKAE